MGPFCLVDVTIVVDARISASAASMIAEAHCTVATAETHEKFDRAGASLCMTWSFTTSVQQSRMSASQPALRALPLFLQSPLLSESHCSSRGDNIACQSLQNCFDFATVCTPRSGGDVKLLSLAS